jgi:hypothetical protein
MGRPPLAHKMTRTEIQRRWRRRKLLGLVGRPPKRAPDDEPAPSEPPADLSLIEELTRELDQARRTLAAIHQSVEPRAAGPDDPGRCFYCHKRQDEVKVMLKGVGRRFTVFTCNECVDRLRQQSDEIIGRGT